MNPPHGGTACSKIEDAIGCKLYNPLTNYPFSNCTLSYTSIIPTTQMQSQITWLNPVRPVLFGEFSCRLPGIVEITLFLTGEVELSQAESTDGPKGPKVMMPPDMLMLGQHSKGFLWDMRVPTARLSYKQQIWPLVGHVLWAQVWTKFAVICQLPRPFFADSLGYIFVRLNYIVHLVFPGNLAPVTVLIVQIQCTNGQTFTKWLLASIDSEGYLPPEQERHGLWSGDSCRGFWTINSNIGRRLQTHTTSHNKPEIPGLSRRSLDSQPGIPRYSNRNCSAHSPQFTVCNIVQLPSGSLT